LIWFGIAEVFEYWIEPLVLLGIVGGNLFVAYVVYRALAWLIDLL
jgi:hypothetical protein